MAQQYSDTARIAIVVGGCFNAIARYPELVNANRVIYVDAADEVDKVIASRPRPASEDPLVSIKLADSMTIRQLLLKVKDLVPQDPISRKHFDLVWEQLHNKQVSLSKGMGQTPILGHLAWLLRQDERLKQRWEEIVRGLAPYTGGSLTSLQILVFHSNAGGTGRGIANQIVHTVTEQFESKNLSITHYVAGRISFTCEEIPDRIRHNAPMGLLEDIALQEDPVTPASTTQLWVGVELPTVGTNSALRSRYAGLWAQAITAQETCRRIDSGRTNIQVVDKWGQFTLVQTGWFTPADFDEDRLVATAARHVIRDIDTALKAKTSFSGRIFFDVGSGNTPPEDDQSENQFLQGLANQCLQGTMTSDLVDAEVERVLYVASEPIFQDETGQRIALDSLEPPPGLSVLQAVQWWQALRQQIRAAMEHEKLTRENEISPQLEKMRKSYKQALSLLFPQGLDRQFQALMQSQGQRYMSFKNAARGYRRLLRADNQAGARQTRLEDSLARADARLQEAGEPLEKLRDLLMTDLFQEIQTLPLHYVQFRTLEDRNVFTALHAEARTEDPVRLKNALLLNYVQGFTLAGIAHILGEGSPSPHAIVRKLDALKFSAVSDAELRERESWSTWEQGPAWGGWPHESYQRICVFPPVVKDTWDKIQQAQKDLQTRTDLARAETIAGGIGIVVLDLCRVYQLTDLLPPDYHQDLKRTLHSCDEVALTHVMGTRVYYEPNEFAQIGINPDPDVAELLGWP